MSREEPLPVDPFDALCSPLSQEAFQKLMASRSRASETPSVRAKRDRQFLPAVPERLFVYLAGLPGKALAVYMILMYRCRVQRQPTVTLSPLRLQRYGITRHQGRHAFRMLEAARLITVTPAKRKQTPVITVHPFPQEPSDG
jgi:hypothetical protein